MEVMAVSGLTGPFPMLDGIKEGGIVTGTALNGQQENWYVQLLIVSLSVD